MPDTPPEVTVVGFEAEVRKWWLHSKTMLFNLLCAVLPLILLGLDTLQANLGLLQAGLSPKAYLAVLIAVAMINMALRRTTATAVSFRKPQAVEGSK